MAARINSSKTKEINCQSSFAISAQMSLEETERVLCMFVSRRNAMVMENPHLKITERDVNKNSDTISNSGTGVVVGRVRWVDVIIQVL